MAELDTRKLDEIIRSLEPRASKIVETWGMKITGDAAMMSPVDTGALKNSLTSESKLRKPLLFILQDGVEYGVFQELGTSRMAAQPFVVPAVEKNTQGFLGAFKKLFVGTGY